jgi:hypothetical protein
MIKKEQEMVLRYSLKRILIPRTGIRTIPAPERRDAQTAGKPKGENSKKLFHLVSHLLISARLYSHLLAYKKSFFTKNGQKEPPCHERQAVRFCPVLIGFRKGAVFGHSHAEFTPPCAA